jgi:hypothetical protein
MATLLNAEDVADLDDSVVDWDESANDEDNVITSDQDDDSDSDGDSVSTDTYVWENMTKHIGRK